MRWINKTNLSSVETSFRNKGRLFLISLSAVMLILLAALAIIVIRDKSNRDDSQKSAYLLLADYSKNKAVIEDTDGKTITETDFPYPSSYMTYHAVTPGGAALMSVGAGSGNESFFFVNRQDKSEITKETSAALAGSLSISGRRDIAFINENTAIMTVCPADKTCNVSRLDIKTGKSEVLVDSGVNSSPISPVYLIGASNDSKTVYIRVFGTNSISSETSAVYKYDTSAKKLSSTIKVPVEAGQNISLSPDEKTLVYKTGGLGKEVVFNLIDTGSSKETKITWNKSEIGNSLSTFKWSPDSQKILFLSSEKITRATSAEDNPQKLAYINIKDNKVTELQVINKTYLNSVSHYSWLDNESIIYDQIKMAKENDFVNANKQTYKQEIGSKKISEAQNPGELVEVLFW